MAGPQTATESGNLGPVSQAGVLDPFDLVLELVRADEGDDPFAFHFAPQRYLVRWEGGVYAGADFPWDDAVLADLERLQRRSRDPAARQRVGERLRTFLGAADWSSREKEIVAAAKAGRPITITIRSAAAELYALP